MRLLAIAGLAGAADPAFGQAMPEYELAPVHYSATAASNAVSALEQRLKAGSWRLATGDSSQAVTSLLAALQVPAASQVLVFSKTSLQRKLISPRNPRAIYFSEDCYVGWVPGGLMEVAVTDPRLGLAFYQLDARAETQPVRIERDADCLSCHGGSLTRDWPGLMVRSMFVDERGEPITSAGSFLIDHESAFAERWGGWYVTGQHGSALHMGNVFAREQRDGATLDRQAGANRAELSGLFPTERYPCVGSDLVALLVLEHQVGLHNRLVQAALRTRRWLHYQESLAKELGEPASSEPTGTALKVIESESERVVDYLLFRQEMVLPEGGVRGHASFQDAFRQHRHVDPEGRSLKDFDLRTRLFTYRCSYMIYALAFDVLPDVLKTRIYQRLHDALFAPSPPARYRYLGDSERRAIREILAATKPSLAASWREAAKR
jgi:hypothetical protein